MQDKDEGYLIGIDLGGTKLAAGRIVKEKVVEEFLKVKTQGEAGPAGVVRQIIQLTERLINSGQDKLKGIGVGVPGSVVWETGVVKRVTNLPGWDNYPLKSILQDHFQVPVVIENDANAAAWAEFKYGAGQGSTDILYLTVSTGIGGGIIVNGRLLRGATGTAGEIGHMILNSQGERCNCGNLGCWETLSSGTAIANKARKLISQGLKSLISSIAEEDIKAEHVFEAYRRGDEVAKIIVEEALDYLGIGIANLVNIINPDKVIIGGGVTQAGPVIFSAVRKKVQTLGYAQAALTQILPAKLNNYGGVIGAAALVKEH